MELRSCTHLHFIQAVRGGLVIMIQNVNRGRPVLKFKDLKDVYEVEDSKNPNSFLQPKEDFEGFIFDRITRADPKDSEFSCSDDNGGSDRDLDDLDAGKMTLKQIIEECKAKKRKRSEVIDSRTEELRTKVKQETAEDECDLMEPLITWKSKLSKMLKTKRSCMKGRVSTPSESALSVGKVEQEESFPAPINIKVEPDSLDSKTAICFNGDSSLIYDIQGDSCRESQKPGEVAEMVMDCDRGTLVLCSDGQNKISSVGNSLIHENQVDSCGDSQNPREVTEIAAECDRGDQALCSDSQNPREVIEIAAKCDRGTQAMCSESRTPISAIGNSSLIYYNQVDSCGLVPKEVTETVSKCDQGIEALISLSKGPQHFVSETYRESMGHADSEPVEIVDSHEDSCGQTKITREATEIAAETVTGTDKLIYLIEDPQCCIMNEACYEYAEHAFSEPLQVPSDSYDDIKEADIPGINNDQFSYLPVSESNGEGYVDQPLSADTIVPVGDGSSDLHDDCPSPSTSEENIDCKEVQIPDVAIHGCLQYTESSHGSDARAPDGNAKDDLLSNLETSAIHSPDADGKHGSDPEYWFTPLADGSPTTGEKQSRKSFFADADSNFFPEMLGQDACEDFMTSDDADYYSKLSCSPQRLLSTRKAISPDSQEKLCKVMESIELQEEEQYRPRKELSFGHQTGKETQINTAERPAKIIRVRSSANQKQNIVKSKNEKRQDQPEGVKKDTNLSQSVPRFSTGCNSIEICSQSAIAFTQRQMQDIECLATKLTNELKTMKEIAEDRLYSQASPATTLKYKGNEVRMAIKNATKVEQLANRWLSMMSRDCNRFCKIMRLAEKDSDAPESESVINKERKKITFADEAGEELCHVKFIESKLTSSLEPDTEKPEMLN